MLFVRVSDEDRQPRLVPMMDLYREMHLVLFHQKPLYNSWMGDATGLICDASGAVVDNHRILDPTERDWGTPLELG